MATQPLQTLLDSVLTRLSALEANAGITPAQVPAAGNDSGEAAAALSPAVLAYDVYMEKAVIPLVEATDKIGTLENLGSLIKDAWGGIRIVVEIASRSKMPPGGDLPKALSAHLKPVQTALESLRKLRLDRKYDWHTKSVMELAGCLSWVLIKPPPQTPSVFVKEAIASSTFWSNKIRKEYKGKDDDQIAFCDGLKKVGHDLVEYVTEHHRTGLTFNPQGGNLADAVATATPETPKTEAPKPTTPKPPAGGGGGIGGLMAELQKKQTSDGASAATGLRKVRKNVKPLLLLCATCCQEAPTDSCVSCCCIGDKGSTNVEKGVQGRKVFASVGRSRPRTAQVCGQAQGQGPASLAIQRSGSQVGRGEPNQGISVGWTDH